MFGFICKFCKLFTFANNGKDTKCRCCGKDNK